MIKYITEPMPPEWRDMTPWAVVPNLLIPYLEEKLKEGKECICHIPQAMGSEFIFKIKEKE